MLHKRPNSSGKVALNKISSSGYTEINIASGLPQVTRRLLIFRLMQDILLRFRGVA
jgi:hypothetical protein